MPDHVVSFVVTEAEQRRLAKLKEHAPGFGLSTITLIEDVIARKAWDALPKETPNDTQ